MGTKLPRRINMKLSEINNNPLAREWKERYSKLSEEKKKKIDELDNMMIHEYQLKVIKRSRTYPEIGDIFKINPVVSSSSISATARRLCISVHFIGISSLYSFYIVYHKKN